MAFKFVIEALGCHAQCFRSVWTVPDDSPYLEGHFPEQPILPAVAIIDASVELLRSALGNQDVQLRGLKGAKFMNPVLPGLTIEIELHKIKDEEWLAEWKSRGPQDSHYLLAKFSLLI